MTLRLALSAGVALWCATHAVAEMKVGKVPLTSAGPLAFGPGGVLFVGDPKAAAVVAVNTGDTESRPAKPLQLSGVNAKAAALIGVKPEDVAVADLAVNPVSNRVYLSVARGKGPDALPVILKVTDAGELAEVSLDKVAHAVAPLSKPVADGPKRRESITGLEFVGGRLYVAGLSNEEFASTLRSLAYPFDGTAPAAGVQIYHGAHGKYETASPVRTFAGLDIGGKEHILAAYTCTPLVTIPVAELTDGAKVKGRTVAELGNRNRPLDIVTYTKGGKPFALLANSARGVMRVDLAGIDAAEPITSRISKTAGLPYTTLEELKGVEQLDKLGEAHAVLLARAGQSLDIRTIDLP